ncbi:defective in Cullin neddylation protein 1 [Thelephora ganbajun]|uniref:Defective in Cullin neddylation protein 1 n=1 Tax=Thelephora ganbajun TaxID=370292 RepID=A0ACB6Z9R3_THEGA|nr:defective in Cullin neddylation protein 1 [Thelephora ganbajun]
MVTYPSLPQPDQHLIPISLSLNSPNPQNQRSFCGVTGASVKDAKKYLEKHKRIENAIDAYYNEGGGSSSSRTTPNGPDPATITQRLNQIYDTYKDSDGDEINVGGALKWCEDLDVDPEDIVLLPIAYELKSPTVGSFPRKPWVDGWKSLGCDSILSMQAALPKLRDKLANDPSYFTSVYNYTFEFAKTGAQRSIGVETAIAFWGLLIPHGLTGMALAHTSNGDKDDGGDASMATEQGWKPEFTPWWFEFLTTKGGKGVSKDTWTMFLDFVRTIDPNFQNHDYESAWPSSIDDFVTYVKEEKLGSS